MSNELVTECVSNLTELLLAVDEFQLAAADQLGINATDTHALIYLLRQGTVPQRDIGRALRLTSGSTTMLIDRLQARGVLRRVNHPTDRRTYLIELTQPDHNDVRRLRSSVRELVRDLPRSDQSRLTANLQLVSQGLRRLAEDSDLWP